MVELANNFGSFIDELDRIGQQGSYTPQAKLKPSKPKNININAPSLGSGYTNLGGGSGAGASSGGGNDLQRLMNAIRSQESNHNYGAINRHSGAAGAYQIMPFNLSFGGGSWDRQALGRSVSRSEFMGSREIQDAIAKWQLGNYLKRYGAPGAAVAWYGGPGAVKNMYSKTTQANGYPSLYAYWQSVLSKM